jgi:hypothetical protein
MKKLFFTLLALMFLFQMFAQDTSKLRVYTRPSGAIIKMNGETLTYGKFIVLDSGEYIIKAWSPKRDLVEKKVILGNNHLKTVAIKLPYSKDYVQYRRRLKFYNFKKYSLRYGFIASYLIFASSYISDISDFNDDASRFEKEAGKYQLLYQQSFWTEDHNFYTQKYNQSKGNYEDAIDEVDKRTRMVQIGAGVTLITTFFGWKLGNTMSKPRFEETPLLSNLTVTPIVGNGQTMLVIKSNF